MQDVTSTTQGRVAVTPDASVETGPSGSAVAGCPFHAKAAGAAAQRPDEAAEAARQADSAVTPVLTEPYAESVIAEWSTDWERAVPRISPDELDHKVANLTHRVREVQLQYFSVDHDAQTMVFHQPEHIPRLLQRARDGEQQIRVWVKRGEHAKAILATEAQVKVTSNLPEALQFGPFKRGATIDGLVRLSHGPGDAYISDSSPGHPGFTLRLQGGEQIQDIILSAGSSGFFAKDADAAVVALEAQATRRVVSAGWTGKVGGTVAAFKTLLAGLRALRGSYAEAFSEATRLVREGDSAAQSGKSLSQTTFFGKLPFQLGKHAVKFSIVPATPGAEGLMRSSPHAGEYFELHEDMFTRLSLGPVKYLLQVQGLPRGNEKANLADARSVWDGKPITIAEITLPRSTKDRFQTEEFQRIHDKMSFSPANRWDKTDKRCLQAIGPIGLLRNAIYAAGAKLRAAKCPFGYG